MYVHISNDFTNTKQNHIDMTFFGVQLIINPFNTEIDTPLTESNF